MLHFSDVGCLVAGAIHRIPTVDQALVGTTNIRVGAVGIITIELFLAITCDYVTR